jgi:hypothetical protein
MPKDIFIVAPCFFQSIRKDSEASGVEFARWHDTLIVGGCSEVHQEGCLPAEVSGDRADGAADNVTE